MRRCRVISRMLRYLAIEFPVDVPCRVAPLDNESEERSTLSQAFSVKLRAVAPDGNDNFLKNAARPAERLSYAHNIC